MNGEMFALVKARPGKGLELTKVPIPKVGYGEVLIRIRKTAICGTDLHIYNWDAWSQRNIVPPLTIGHEYVGVIEELGEGVEGLQVGQRGQRRGPHHLRPLPQLPGRQRPVVQVHQRRGRQPGRRVRAVPVPSGEKRGAHGRVAPGGRGVLLRRLRQRHPHRAGVRRGGARMCW